MRRRTTLVKKTFGPLTLLTFSLLLASCQGGSSSGFDNIGGETTNNGTTSDPNNSALLEDQTDLLSPEFLPNDYSGKAAIGVKNFDQIFYSMVEVTGLSATPLTQSPLKEIYGTAGTSGTYLNLKPGLPATNAASGFSPSQMLNILTLATTFCDKMAKDPQGRKLLLQGSGLINEATSPFNFISASPSTTFADANKRADLSAFFANKFWGPKVDGDLDRQASEDQITSLIVDLSSGSASPTPTIQSVVTGACAAALGSPHMVLF
jgi:hypothetical protein